MSNDEERVSWGQGAESSILHIYKTSLLMGSQRFADIRGFLQV